MQDERFQTCLNEDRYDLSDDSREILDFFIFCLNNLYSELFSKIPDQRDDIYQYTLGSS